MLKIRSMYPDAEERKAELMAANDAKGEEHVHRRLRVKPGITGLWQVSGRDDLEWEQAVRLDLYYVENWSPVQDFVIMLRTVRAVVAKEGALTPRADAAGAVELVTARTCRKISSCRSKIPQSL